MDFIDHPEAERVKKLIREGKGTEAIGMLEKDPSLLNAYYHPYGPLLVAAAWGGRDVELVIRYLLEHGVHPNISGEGERTALHQTMRRPFEYGEVSSIVRVLLDHGADINQRDKYGWTPLHDAAMGSHYETAVKLLVDLGANVNAEIGGTGGETALDLLYESNVSGGRSVCHWLKTKGATSKKERHKRAISKTRGPN